MLLALWSGFWNSADWVQPVPPPPSTATKSNAGSGGEYTPASHEYWAARAAMIARHNPIVPRETDTREAATLIQRHADIVQKLPLVLTPINIRDLNRLLDKLALRIEQMRVESDNEAILALLLAS